MNTLILLTKRGNNLNIEDFDYHLPESLIAQTPLKTETKVDCCLSKDTGELTHILEMSSIILSLVIHWFLMIHVLCLLDYLAKRNWC